MVTAMIRAWPNSRGRWRRNFWHGNWTTSNYGGISKALALISGSKPTEIFSPGS
jgi:hypothetical protein